MSHSKQPMIHKSHLLDSIIQNAIDGIITTDENGVILTINPAACTLFGYSEAEAKGNNVVILMTAPDDERHDHYIRSYRRTGERHIIGIDREVTGRKKNGTVFPFRLGISEVVHEGKQIYTAFIHDLSQDKKIEESLKQYAAELERLVNTRADSLKNAVKALQIAKADISRSLVKEQELGQLQSRFISMASQEFRTPLSAIQLSAGLIEKYATTGEKDNAFRHIAKVKSAVGYLSNMLNDFLSLEKLEADKLSAQMVEFDLAALADDVVEEMSVIAKAGQQIIHRHSGTTNKAKLDPAMLKTCIINLVSNAIKYANEGIILLETAAGESGCSITISDKGIGIPSEDRDHLFEPFFRGSNATNLPGSGLGLNVLSRYVKLMNGKIQVESVINKGTSFHIYFNYHEEENIDH